MRMPLWALVLIFLVVPIAELYVIYLVGDAIGVLADPPPSGGGFVARLAPPAVTGPLGLETASTRRWPPDACLTAR